MGALETEIDDILRELLRTPGALAASLAATGAAVVDPELTGELRRVSIGDTAELVVALDDGAPAALDEAILRAARALRACLTMWRPEGIPEVHLTGRAPRTRAALIKRVEKLLQALAATVGARVITLIVGRDTLTSVGEMGDAERERLPFLRKRIDAEAARQRGKSSHAEIAAADVYARSFWFDAYLVLFFAGEWAPDFVRHRVRAVARELAAVLPWLDDDPPALGQIRPLPPR